MTLKEAIKYAEYQAELLKGSARGHDLINKKSEGRRMDNNEARRIQSAIRCIKLAVDIDPWTMERAVEAMKKQIPMEPKFITENRFTKKHSYPCCARCGNKVVTGDMYCIHCGQAIDWEDNG